MISSMSVARSEPAAVTLPESSNVLVCGGTDDDEDGVSCEEYEWQSNEWKNSNVSLSIPRFSYGLFIVLFDE